MAKTIDSFIKRMENDLCDFEFENVTFVGEDSHAWYFNGVDTDKSIDMEIKVEKKDYYSWYREPQNEDWGGMDYLYDKEE
jgi:hypothetical protein